MPTNLRQLKPLGWEFSETPHDIHQIIPAWNIVMEEAIVSTIICDLQLKGVVAETAQLMVELRGPNLQFNIQSRRAIYSPTEPHNTR